MRLGRVIDMKYILFCNQPYAFSILEPIEREILHRGGDVLWYVPAEILNIFPYQDKAVVSKIKYLLEFKSDAIIVPGNDVPHYLRGVKVQVFHGFASEKKGHFRIRDYFDLYLTQGPHFTGNFKRLTQARKDISVVETGWSKLDKLFRVTEGSADNLNNVKQKMLNVAGAKYLVLYAPTFSPKLTSAEVLFQEIQKLADYGDVLLVCKFHDLMNESIVKRYASSVSNTLIVSEDVDVLPMLKMADVMISDTSSVIYEFILLDKPVVSYRTRSKSTYWEDALSPEVLVENVKRILKGGDDKKDDRAKLISEYHPYTDGRSSSRVVDAIDAYINEFGIPEYRRLSFHRKYKMYKKYGFRVML